MRVLFALFLIAHGLIHASYLSPQPKPTPGAPEWPFNMADSWLVTTLGADVSLVRTMGTVLVVLVVIGSVLAGFAWLGIVIPRDLWPALVTGSALTSLVLLATFFHPWIALGFVIDAVLLWLVFGAGWTAEVASAA